jgi:LysM repeat protein
MVDGLDKLADMQILREAAQRPPVEVQQMQMPSPDAGLQNIIPGQTVDMNTGLPMSSSPADAVNQVTQIAGQYAMANPQKTAPFAAALAAFGAGSEAANMIDKRVEAESEKENLDDVKSMAGSLSDRTRTVMPTMDMPVQAQEEIQVSEVAPQAGLASMMPMSKGGSFKETKDMSVRDIAKKFNVNIPIARFMKRKNISRTDNLKEFADKVALIESSGGRDKINKVSSARGTYQFLTDVNQEGQSSIETALNRVETIYKRSNEKVPAFVNTIRKAISKDKKAKRGYTNTSEAVLNLSKPEEDILFWSNITQAGKKKNDEGTDNKLVKIIQGDNAAAKSLYGMYHHTNPDTKTFKKMDEIFTSPSNPLLDKTENDLRKLASLEKTSIQTPNIYKQYTVKKGDNLTTIANKLGTTLEEIRNVNDDITLANQDNIRINQKINIPVMEDDSFIRDVPEQPQDQSIFDTITAKARAMKSLIGLQEGGDVGEYFEGQVEGKGDGMSDEIPFQVEGGNPDFAMLSKDEYVIPADVVAMLGNGSSDAGADELDDFVKDTRKEAFGREEQQTEIDAEKGLSSIA